MLTGVTRAAAFSPCGRYRLHMGRTWDGRPRLLACMFNPSEANGEIDDPTTTLLMRIASHNGYGGVTVVNGIPLISSTPGDAVAMVRTWEQRRAWDERDALQRNLATIQTLVAQHRDVLLAWGALADRCPEWFDHVAEQIREVMPPFGRLLCLGRTVGGYPIHPLARGRMKVRPDARLVPWSPA